MTRIAKCNEKQRPVENKAYAGNDATTIVVEAAVKIAKSDLAPKIDAVVVFTETGHTARAISRYRLSMPVIAVTDKQSSAEQLTISFGVVPVVTAFPDGLFTTPEKVLADLVSRDIVKKGDNLLIVHGHHWQKAGLTNAMQITSA
jgi:pyruvate kinase